MNSEERIEQAELIMEIQKGSMTPVEPAQLAMAHALISIAKSLASLADRP